MKILSLLEDSQKRMLLQFQQDLIDALPEEWDVGLTNNYGISLNHPDMPGKVWFGPVDYADLPEPTNTKRQVEAAVIDNYDIGASEIMPLKAVCTDTTKCTVSILLNDLTAAYYAILIYNGMTGLQDASEDVQTIVDHLLTDVRPG